MKVENFAIEGIEFLLNFFDIDFILFKSDANHKMQEKRLFVLRSSFISSQNSKANSLQIFGPLDFSIGVLLDQCRISLSWGAICLAQVQLG